jgi:hypothetical protein
VEVGQLAWRTKVSWPEQVQKRIACVPKLFVKSGLVPALTFVALIIGVLKMRSFSAGSAVVVLVV